MKLPFTIAQFLDVFEKYNLAVWPMQIVMIILAAAVITLSVKKFKSSDKVISIILAFFWIWIGIAYHFIFFASINKAAYLFGGLFILQGLIFLYIGLIRSELSFKANANLFGIVGAILIVYALVLYPIIGFIRGHIYPHNPTFGLPCPTTIFTFGILLWMVKSAPKRIWIIPFIWAIIGSSAAVSLSMAEDYGLALSALLSLALVLFCGKSMAMETIKTKITS